MTMARASVLSGPAILQWTPTGGSAATIYTKDDIKVATKMTTFPIETSAYGKVDERVSDILTEVTFTPAGEWEAAAIAALFPHTNPVMGTSIFTATDQTLTIHPLNGTEKIVYNAVAVTKMPDIILSAAKTVFGPCTLLCTKTNNTAWSAAASRYTISNAAFSDTSFATANVKTVTYSAALGALSSPWNAISTKEGFTVSFDLKTTPVVTDDEGTIDMLVSGLEVTVKFAPMNATLADVLTLMKIQNAATVLRGMSMNTDSANLVITGAGSGSPIVTVNSVRLKTSPQQYSFNSNRHGDLEFIATRTTGSGAMFALTTSA